MRPSRSRARTCASRLPPLARAAPVALLGLAACGFEDGATTGYESAAPAAPNAEGLAKGAPDPGNQTAEAPRPEGIAPNTPHPFDARDLLALEGLSGLELAPDGRSAVFVRRHTDLAANKGRTDLWRVDLADPEHRLTQLTSDPAADYAPVFAPDGKRLFFLSTRSASAQVWELALAEGEASARQVTDLPLDLANLRISPTGERLAFTAEVFLDCEDLACTRERLDAREASARTGQAYDRLFVRHWDQWKDGRRSHLFVMPAAGGAPVDVSAGMDADVPSKPFGGAEEFTFTPDGEGMVFTARDAGRSEPWSTNFDLFYVELGGEAGTRAVPRKLTDDNAAWDTHPVFSPDGKTLAYLAMKRPGFEADRFRLVTRAWPEGDPVVVSESWDRSISDFVFTPDGEAVLAVAGDTGQTPLFRLPLASGKPEKLLGDGRVSSPRPTPDGEAVYLLRDDLGHPFELERLALGPDGPDAADGPERITHINDARVELAQRGDFEPFSFKGAGGDTVHGWLIKPANFDPERRYPLAFLIHGGPQGSFSNRFHRRWNPQVYAGAGYVAVMIDFHGSTGYGQAFTDAIRGDWGGKPLEDLQKGLAHLLKRYPFIDGERVCALGASYGGFMINWIAGQWPDGFACLVNHDGVFDQRTMYYATEELWFPEWEHGGPYYAARAGFERHNPVEHVDAWKTPMLVIHGSLDYRVPIEQGLGAFTALQRRNIESRFLHFPDENHWVLHPANSLQWHEEVLGWLDRFIGEAKP